MKMDTLVTKSEAFRKINSKLVRVVQYKAGRDKKGYAVAMARTYTRREVNVHRHLVPARDQNKYVSSIRFLDKKLNVEVSCSCPDYVFAGWEWSNAQVGASKIIYGNGEPPSLRNPGHRPGLCKHLIALRALIKDKHGL